MSYRLVYTHRAVKDLQGIDPKMKERLGKTLMRYANDPLRYAIKLTDPATGTYRFRVGDYRVIFDLEGDEIVVLRVEHRKQIYKR